MKFIPGPIVQGRLQGDLTFESTSCKYVLTTGTDRRLVELTNCNVPSPHWRKYLEDYHIRRWPSRSRLSLMRSHLNNKCLSSVLDAQTCVRTS